MAKQNLFVTEFLKRNERDVNHQVVVGRTALMLAAEENTDAFLALLDKDGLDVTLEDIRGKCLLDYGLNSHDPSILAIIKTRLTDFNQRYV